MGQIEKIAKIKNLGFISRNNLFLFDKSTALKLLQACSEFGYIILGIEGFYLSNDEIIPEMDAIADFSNLKGSSSNMLSNQSIEDARQFLLSQPDSALLFNFTLDEREQKS